MHIFHLEDVNNWWKKCLQQLWFYRKAMCYVRKVPGPGIFPFCLQLDVWLQADKLSVPGPSFFFFFLNQIYNEGIALDQGSQTHMQIT